MTAIINLEISNEAKNQLQQIATKQIPFAIAKSLTQTAQLAQTQVRNHIKEKFHIRKKSGGFESSIRIKPATKQNLTAEVYSMAAFASLQQTGGIKKAKDGRLAIPSYQNISEVKKRSNSNSPSSFLANGAFKIKARSGQEMIVTRDKNKELKILYFLRKNADVTKSFEMIEITTKTAKNQFESVFVRNFREVK